MPLPNPALPPAPVRLQIRGRALVAEHTMRSYFIGRPVREVSRLRIEMAMRELGLENLIRPLPDGGGAP